MERLSYIQHIQQAYRSHSIVALLGPRQCGKTTLARMYTETHPKASSITYFDLEDPVDLARLETPKSLLEQLEGLVVIDEIQRLPHLFPLLRVLVDRPHNKTRFLILGSASRELIQQSSETLAGRIAHLEITPFTFDEVPELERLWLRGGFPRSYLAKSTDDSWIWRKNYIKTFLEQDIPNLGIQIPPMMLRRFWMMLVHYHGNIFNASEISRSLGISDTTGKRYLDILVGTFMVRYLVPWHENLGKRQVKSPKIYFRDSGILHSLLAIENKTDLLHHPKLGASWEGFALEEVIRHSQVDAENCYFWAVHSQAELDLLIFKNGKRIGFEFKFSDAPRLTPSMQVAMELLKINQMWVIYPGEKDYSLTPHVHVCGLKNYLKNNPL